MRRLTALGAALLITIGLNLGFGFGFGGVALAQGLADVRLGNEAFREGDFASAVRHYTQAIRSGELVGEALAITYNNRGVAHGEAGDFDPAIADYSQAMALRPGDATTVRNLRVAHVRRGELAFASGAYDDAVADFTRAIELEPEHHLAYQRRGELYTELGLVDLAVDDLERAMLLSPGDAEVSAALERATAQRDRVATTPAAGTRPPAVAESDDTAPGDPTAADAIEPAAPEVPALAESPAAALPREPVEESADTPSVAAVPTPAPRQPVAETEVETGPEADAELEPSPAPAPAAERVIDMSPARPAAPQAEVAAEPPASEPEAAPAAPSTTAATENRTAASEGEPYRVVSAVNYRAGPDNDAQRLGTVDAGRIVRVTGDTLGWKHVILPNGDRGFIYGSWLEPAGN